jgi:hypothetical protein
MSGPTPRWPAGLALGGSLLGLVFGGYSSFDYTKHLDRQVHDIHCSFIPGVGVDTSAENACRVAMYSPFSALFRDRYWGGVPISLFALGAFAFFTAFSAYLLLARETAPRRAVQFLGIAGLTPLIVSIVMAVISATRLGQFCKTCVGIYGASALLAIGGIAGMLHDRREAAAPAPKKPGPAREAGGVAPTVVDDALEEEAARRAPARREGGVLLAPVWLLALGIFAVTPALLYVSALPSYASYVNQCGKLEKPTEANNALLQVKPAGATQPATMFVDPLCPTCKGVHQRLVAEGIFDQLETQLVLFPLDSDCNKMLDQPLHPGSCLVSKAVICGEHRALQVLEWAYDNQEKLLAGAKAGAGLVNVRAAIRERWPELDACVDAKETKLRQDRMLRFIVDNHLPVSTPQLYFGETRLCDEDSDIGLPYTVRKLAPGLKVR